MQIHHNTEDQEYYFKEGCFILEYLNNEEDPDVSIARARVEAGATTKLHRLKETTERYLILEGEGRAQIDGQPIEVRAGSVIVIPPGTSQCITNTGSADLVFLAICSPRFVPGCYEELSS